MELQVSNTTVSRVTKQYVEKEFITKRELPDLDCKYVGSHLSNQLYSNEGCSINFKALPLKLIECFGVLYNNIKYTDLLLMNRLKKMKV